MQFYLTSAASITSLFSIFAIVRHQQRINRVDKKIRFVERKPVYSPTELLKSLGSEQTAKSAGFTPIYEGQTLTGFRGEALIKVMVCAIKRDKLTEFQEAIHL